MEQFMKNKKHHVFTILLIIFMIFIAVSTSRPPPKEIKNSLSYETHEEYFIIRIKSNSNPKSYGDYNKDYATLFCLSYKDIEKRQCFSYVQGEYTIETKDSEGNIIEKILLDQPPFEMYIEGRYFIIKIKNEFLKYRDYTLDSIFLHAWHGGDIYEIYIN
jgi:hypothetical protein